MSPGGNIGAVPEGGTAVRTPRWPLPGPVSSIRSADRAFLSL